MDFVQPGFRLSVSLPLGGVAGDSRIRGAGGRIGGLFEYALSCKKQPDARAEGTLNSVRA